MKASNVRFLWRDPAAARYFGAGVCLHGHTMHSQECLSFLPRYLHQAPGISHVVRRYEQPRAGTQPVVDFSRAYWTPPLSPATALRVEREQIENLGLLPLVSLNHPFWLGEGVKGIDHDRALGRLLRECGGWIHALELNGTRSWKENGATMALAGAYSRPVISGGDRHACEPAACINLTNARTFSNFVAEVRAGYSTVVFLPRYQEPMALRILEASWDVLRPYPEYQGRERWIDRIYYRCEDGNARPLSVVWKDEVPWMLDGAKRVLELFATTKLRSAIRLLPMQREEILP